MHSRISRLNYLKVTFNFRTLAPCSPRSNTYPRNGSENPDIGIKIPSLKYNKFVDKDLSLLYVMFTDWSFAQLGAYLDEISRSLVDWFKGKIDNIKKLR